MRRSLQLLILVFLIMSVARDASADLSAFTGANRTPSNRTVGGVALSLSLLVIGFEFEYSHSAENPSARAPSLRTGMFNIELQTPTVSGLRFYGTVGGGLYRERLATHQETAFGANVGGGVKIAVVGPIGVRFDYRVFSLSGDPFYNNPQRIYVGLNVAF